jgi:glycolate oxidase FAD binding subunit
MSTLGVTSDLADALCSVLSAAAISTATDAFVVDGLRPSLVVKPSTQEEVALVLGVANEAGATVIPWGGGSHMPLGNPPARYDLALDLTGLDRVIEYEPADLTVTVEAGIRLDVLQRLLAEQGQWLPLDPPADIRTTLGGILATNASGAARIAYGTGRDLVIGMTVATARGEIVKSGGRVVKNVAGYDLAKLHIGALGTLGVILQASFKIAPLPAETCRLVTPSMNPVAAFRLAQAIGGAGLAVTGAAVFGEGVNLSAFVRLAGSAAAVERSRKECQALAVAAETSFADADVALGESFSGGAMPNPQGGVLCRVVARPAAMPDLVTLIMNLGGRVLTYPAAGLCFGTWPEDSASVRNEITRFRQRLGPTGAVVVEGAPPEFKKKVDVWGPPRDDFPLMRRLKDEMDPHGILNPGRFVGGI